MNEVQKPELLTRNYIGTKALQAMPMTLGVYNKHRGWAIPENEDPNREGYLVKYSDDYESWSPKEVFEKAYFEVSDATKITLADVRNFLKEFEVSTIGEKTTLVRAILANSFEIIETSSCVDPANYNEQLGAEYAIAKIENKVFELLGFLLQTANNGVK